LGLRAGTGAGAIENDPTVPLHIVFVFTGTSTEYLFVHESVYPHCGCVGIVPT
jgi:hypothetical protein